MSYADARFKVLSITESELEYLLSQDAVLALGVLAAAFVAATLMKEAGGRK